MPAHGWSLGVCEVSGGRCSCCSLGLSVPAPRRRVAGGLPRMPSSQHQANPSQRERRCDRELEHFGLRKGGGRKRSVEGWWNWNLGLG